MKIQTLFHLEGVQDFPILIVYLSVQIDSLVSNNPFSYWNTHFVYSFIQIVHEKWARRGMHMFVRGLQFLEIWT